jgi:hypothetical protein
MNYNREQFEQYAAQIGKKDFKQDEFGNYRNPFMQGPWDFWRASRDALAALPSDAGAPSTECGGSASIKCQSKHCPQEAQPDERAAFGWPWGPAEPTTKMLREMAYELKLVPQGEVVCVQFIDILRSQYKAAFNAARAASQGEKQ